ncbi:hypothetical protein GCM10008927_14640 [Amylibacter ulvae]|uniref:Glycosyl transferase family 2 n=2 Tax=Paramylibacter ulvae TaxID=1651968 RepID=A0ABQ3CYX5_9RHOB|nr:hypothetical protein GCM10008927_14640 [Amylibacter ulvae]
MVRDETFFLHNWHRHYAREFGDENLFVIDHNSQTNPPQSVIPSLKNITRIPFDNPAKDKQAQDRRNFDHVRFHAISDMMASLLHYYDCVIYNDVDEIFVTDDTMGLRQYLDSIPEIGNRAGVGVELFQHTSDTPFDPTQPVFEQRKHFYYRWNICRPCILTKPTLIGGNGAVGPVWLDPKLLMLHLRFVDNDELFQRQQKRLLAYSESRGGEASRWKLSLGETQEKMDAFWARTPAEMDMPHYEFLDECIPGYRDTEISDATFKRQKKSPRQQVKLDHFFDQQVVKLFWKYRFEFPDRFNTYPS